MSRLGPSHTDGPWLPGRRSKVKRVMTVASLRPVQRPHEPAALAGASKRKPASFDAGFGHAISVFAGAKSACDQHVARRLVEELPGQAAKQGAAQLAAAMAAEREQLRSQFADG